MAQSYRNHPITEVFPALSEDEYQTLKNDIKENGLLEPIWIDAKRRVIDGRHRLRACRELKIEPEFQETEYSEEDIPGVVVGLNLRRRHMNESQRAYVAAKMVPYLEKAAKSRAAAGKDAESQEETTESLSANLRSKGGKGTKADKSDKATKRKSAAKAAAVVGVGSRSVEDAKRVLENGCDELIAVVQAGEIAVSDAAKVAKETKATQKKLIKMVATGQAKHLRHALRLMKQEEQIKQIEALDPAQGGYPVVVADPAWPYEARKEDTTQRGKTPYPQMTLAQICKLVVPAADDSILFLWVTNSHLVNGNAARVCGAWGFQPKTLLTWVKNRMGTGDWARSQTEHVVIGVRGHPKLKEVPSTVFEAPVAGHSVKPEEFYQLVERCTAGSKIELFARKQREGWFCHGHGLNQPIATEDADEPCDEPDGPPAEPETTEPEAVAASELEIPAVDMVGEYDRVANLAAESGPQSEPQPAAEGEIEKIGPSTFDVPQVAMVSPPPVPNVPQERLDKLQEKLKGGKRKNPPPKVVVPKGADGGLGQPSDPELTAAMAEARAEQARERADELS